MDSIGRLQIQANDHLFCSTHDTSPSAHNKDLYLQHTDNHSKSQYRARFKPRITEFAWSKDMCALERKTDVARINCMKQKP
jgi:hypothetical protein